MALLPEHNEVSGWDLTREVIKVAAEPLSTAQKASARQTRSWAGLWYGASLGTVIVLALLHAPVIAFVTPPLIALIATSTATRRNKRSTLREPSPVARRPRHKRRF